MGDVGETFNALRKHRKEKKASNQKWSTEHLEHLGVEFESKNGGNHLIVRRNEVVADFWPSTGKYKLRSSQRYRRGVGNLLKDLGVKNANN